MKFYLYRQNLRFSKALKHKPSKIVKKTNIHITLETERLKKKLLPTSFQEISNIYIAQYFQKKQEGTIFFDIKNYRFFRFRRNANATSRPSWSTRAGCASPKTSHVTPQSSSVRTASASPACGAVMETTTVETTVTRIPTIVVSISR